MTTDDAHGTTTILTYGMLRQYLPEVDPPDGLELVVNVIAPVEGRDVGDAEIGQTTRQPHGG